MQLNLFYDDFSSFIGMKVNSYTNGETKLRIIEKIHDSGDIGSIYRISVYFIDCFNPEWFKTFENLKNCYLNEKKGA